MTSLSSIEADGVRDLRDQLDAAVVPARNLLQLVALGRRQGIAGSRALAGLELDLSALEDPRTRLSPRIEIEVIRNLLDGGLDPATALETQGFTVAQYGLLGYAMMSCATLGQAMRIAMKYYRTAGPLVALRFRVEDDEALVEAEDVIGLGSLRPFVVERLFVRLPPLLAELLGTVARPVEVRLAYPPPAHADRHAAAFAAPVRFAAHASQFRFPAELLDRPLVRADADSASLFERSCRELLAEIDGETSLTSRISRMLLASPGHVPTSDEMARQLNMGGRTLRRRLGAQGTSYQTVLDEVRRRIAEDYLRSTDLAVQEVAELLGYSEATNFRRAFTKWTGRTPSAYRREPTSS